MTVWQTAADGRYDIQNGIEEIDCRGIFTADAEGKYVVRTVRPLGYSSRSTGPSGRWSWPRTAMASAPRTSIS